MKHPKDPSITTDIYSILYELGVSAETTSFFHTAYAIYIAMENPQKLLLVTKWLYPEVAKHYHTTWNAVERSIRRTIQLIWLRQARHLEKLAGKPLYSRPTPSQFLTIVANRLSEDHAA